MSAPAQVFPWDDAAWRHRAAQFARSLGLGPEHDALMVRALTHRSLREVAPHGDNERLEFLGDSVLALLVNDYLYRIHEGHSEGQLTKLKARYVSEPSLALAAVELGLGELLAMAAGDEVAGGRTRPSTLSDTFEAVLAALYLARGLSFARDWLRRELIERVDPTEVWDYKSRLQELFQEQHRLTPTYQTAMGGGTPHDPVFSSEVAAGEVRLGSGTGRSKKLAEQAAAANALELLQAAASTSSAESGPAPTAAPTAAPVDG